MPAILPQSWYVYYTGTNVIDVLAMLNHGSSSYENTWRVARTDPGTGQPVIKKGYEEEHTLTPNRYVVRFGNGAFGAILEEDEFAYRYAGTVDSFLSAPSTFTAMGVGSNAASIAIGATANLDVQVVPPLPVAGVPRFLSKILSVSGVTLGQVTIAATPTVLTAFVPAAVVNGVIVPDHTVVRNRVKNSGIGLLSSVQVMTTVYVI